MDESDVHEAIPTKGEKAMCIYGYEYEYAESLVNIGFNSETEKVRRVTTKNPVNFHLWNRSWYRIRGSL